MAAWHLDDIQRALERKGWRITMLAGDGYRISATWRLTHANDARTIEIDFDGLDDMSTLPIEQSYGCEQRGTKNRLYFTRRGTTDAAAQQRWRDALATFVDKMSEPT